MPHKVWAVGEEVLAADFNTFVQDQVVSTYPSLTVLQSDWPNAPIGAQAVTTDTNIKYQKVATGAAGWITRGATVQTVALSGTIPNSTSPITIGALTIAAAPFARVATVTASIGVSTTAAAVWNLSVDASGGVTATTSGRGRDNGTSTSIPTLPLAIPANAAVTLTASAAFTSAPAATGTIVNGLSRMDAVLVPA